MRYVIVGNGVAGVTAADTIRRLDPEGSLTLIGRESFPPYCRPMISNFLAGTAELEELPIRPENYYEELRARAYLGVEATTVDTTRREVTTTEGTTVPYDRLLVASGADPYRIEADNLDLRNIFFMRTVRDAMDMIHILPEIEHVLVLGGGLVGFKAAHGFLSRGKKVTMLIRSGYPLSMQVDETAGEIIKTELERHGLEVRTGVEVTAFEGDETDRVREAQLSDRSNIGCDAVVVGKGVFPARSYLGDEFNADAGLLVDDYLNTNVHDVWAAGDVAEHRDVARRRPWVNAIWPVAVEMGRVAGSNMAGQKVRYRGSLSRNVIRMFELDVMTAGIVSPRESGDLEAVFHRDQRRNTYRKLLLDDEGVLVGFVLVNDIDQGGVLMNMVHEQRRLNGLRKKALGPHFNVGQVIDTAYRSGSGPVLSL